MRNNKGIRPQVLEPYTAVDVEKWNEALRLCEAAREQCERGIAAGFPCDEDLNACKALRDQLTKMKKVYAPGMP